MKRWFAKLILLFHVTYSYASSCMDMLNSCPEGQTCMESTGQCGCTRGYVLSGDKCVSPDTHGGHSAILITMVLVAVALITTGLVLLARNYGLVDWVRQKWEARHRDVLYEDVMIGQDDPPLPL